MVKFREWYNKGNNMDLFHLAIAYLSLPFAVYLCLHDNIASYFTWIGFMLFGIFGAYIIYKNIYDDL